MVELAQLRSQLEDMRATFDSIRSGGVDAIMVGDVLDERVYTLSSADRPYRVILDEMGEGAITVSERGVLLYVNRRFAALVGRDSRELVGTAVTGLVGEIDHPQLLDLLSVPAGRTRRGELNLRCQGERVVPVLSSATGLDVEGVLVRCLIVADLTVVKRTEQELLHSRTQLEKINAALASSNTELERSNRELEVYASAISHDLREPLRTMAGFVDLINARYAADLPEGARELFGFVLGGITRMEARISTILDYARSGAGVAPPHPVDSGAVAEAAIRDVATIVADTGAVVAVGDLPIIEADPTQLQRVFQNLLTNAVLHRTPNTPPRIAIEARKLDGHWQFTISDNGPGVPIGARERVFHMFSRGASTGPPEGHGMGLALCRRIIGSYGGEIWVEDNPGGGSRFCFTLPAGDKAPAADEITQDGKSILESHAFRWLFQRTPEATMLTGPDGTVYAANPVMCTMVGRTESELIAQGPLSWIEATDRIRWTSAIAEWQEDGHCQLTLSVRHSNGTSSPTEVASDIVTDGSGRRWVRIIVREILSEPAQIAGQQGVVAHAPALRDAYQQADITQRIAVGVNDDIVQSLVAAEMAFDLGYFDQARESLAAASRAARNWVGELLLAAGQPEPGSLVRTQPSISNPNGAT